MRFKPTKTISLATPVCLGLSNCMPTFFTRQISCLSGVFFYDRESMRRRLYERGAAWTTQHIVRITSLSTKYSGIPHSLKNFYLLKNSLGGLTFEMPKSDKGKRAKVPGTHVNSLQCKMKTAQIGWKRSGMAGAKPANDGERAANQTSAR
jgi:hypothetical protein